MFKIVEGNNFGLADVDGFIDLINDPPPGLLGLFERNADIFVTRAPGRLDVMGGIADYSGSIVLEMPIAEATLAAIQKSTDRKIKIVSLYAGSTKYSTFEMDVFDLRPNGKPLEYSDVKEYFGHDRSRRWAAYAAGVFFVLRRELGVDLQHGCRIAISSHVPVGKGVSSSAALEVAVMQAVCTAFDISIEPRDLALLCQKVENLIVGAACGVMDQVAAHCGVENALISLVCQPAEIGDPVMIPDDIEFWGIDSGVRHAVAGADYTSVRVGAFMGYRMIADLAGFERVRTEKGLVTIVDPRWHGYLANVSPEEYEREFRAKIPVEINGREFLERYGGTTDHVTKVDPRRTYAVKAPAEHAIYESSRVKAFATMLGGTDLKSLGELMFASHKSYAACGLTEPRTDRIVELVRENGCRELFGARITGGGSGGTVVVLARKGSDEAIRHLADAFTAEVRQAPYLFHGSSPGCAAFSAVRLSSI